MKKYTFAEMRHGAEVTKLPFEGFVRAGEYLESLDEAGKSERRASPEEKTSITRYVEGAERVELTRLTNADILANAGIPVTRHKAQGPRSYATREQKRVLQITDMREAAE